VQEAEEKAAQQALRHEAAEVMARRG
jgi:hypothetical protein